MFFNKPQILFTSARRVMCVSICLYLDLEKVTEPIELEFSPEKLLNIWSALGLILIQLIYYETFSKRWLLVRHHYIIS